MADVTGQFYAGDAAIGYGTEIGVGQGGELGSPTGYTSIPNVKSITLGDMTTGVIDVTHLRSLNRHREHRATLRDSGPIAIICAYRPEHGAHREDGGDGFSATHNLVSLWKNVTENTFKLTFPDDLNNLELIIQGVITRYHPNNVALEEEMTCEIEITPLQDYFANDPAGSPPA